MDAQFKRRWRSSVAPLPVAADRFSVRSPSRYNSYVSSIVRRRVGTRGVLAGHLACPPIPILQAGRASRVPERGGTMDIKR
jgi:hypothetical protein